jgi:RNA polymerase sigma factor (sigma-70 family)
VSETADDVRLAQDDRAAGFAALYARLAPSVLAWARLRIPSVLRGAIDPEDVVQEVWRRAYERFPSFDPARAPFRAWVFRIANLVLMEGLRRAKTRVRAAGGDDTRDPAAAALDPATTVSRAVAADEALAGFIAAALREEDEDRRLFAYRLEGLTFEECGERLGTTPAAARKRWQRLRERLADLARRTGLVDDES